MSAIEISSLSPEERLGLIEQLWESLAQDAASIPLTAAQREELDARLDDMRRYGTPSVSWEAASANLRKRLG